MSGFNSKSCLVVNVIPAANKRKQMPVYYSNQVSGDRAVLDEEESGHCIKVLRLKKGDPLRFVDGTGNLYEGIIEVPDSKTCELKVTRTIENHLARQYHLHLAIAPTKSTDRFEWFLEKATEIGVDMITPLICERSERKKIRMDRSRRILISAMKQSGRACLPILSEPLDFASLIQAPPNGMRLIAHCQVEGDRNIGSLARDDNEWMVLIGPEGDFTESEIKAARESGFQEVNLGDAVLRTETAGIVACQSIASLYRK